MHYKNNILVFLLAASCLLSQSAYAAGVGAIDAINTHDMDFLKQKQRQQTEFQDFQELKKREAEEKAKQENPDNDDKKKTDAQSKTLIKAQASEFETKGVYIDKVEFSPSGILSNNELNAIAQDITGKNVFFPEIQSVVEKVNNLYMEKGYVTARAIIGEQTMENGVLQITLVESKIGSISIDDNRWTKDSYISKRIKEKSGDLFEITGLERDILNFNRYNDGVQLSANLEPGQTPGTTDIGIKAVEKLPFHLTGMFDNAGRYTIGTLRGGIMVANDSLFGYRDRLTSGAYISKSSVTPFADYNIPVNRHDGRVGFMFSSSHAQVNNGNFSMFNIKSRSFNYSLYFNQPIIRKPFFELTSVNSINYKTATTSFDNVDLSTDKITSFQTGLNARYDTKRGIWYLTQSAYHAFPIVSSDSKYFKYEGSVVRLHDLGHGIIAQLRGNYQWVPQDVIPFIDQFQAGGISSVRGYSEGLLIGKTGYLLSSEIIFPIAPKTIKVKGNKKPFLGQYVKGAFFVDHAGVMPFKGSGPGQEGINANDFLVSTGMGLRISLPGELTARLYWGYPLLNNAHENVSRIGRFHFDLSMSPDFEAILKHRRPKEKL